MEQMLTVEMQIANRSKKYPKEALTNLHEFIDEQMLHSSYLELNKEAAGGVDGETWSSYGQKWEERKPELLTAFKSGKYRAPNIRRVYITQGRWKNPATGLANGRRQSTAKSGN